MSAHYSPVDYYVLGGVYPRDQLRKPYPRRSRRVVVALFRSPPTPPPAGTFQGCLNASVSLAGGVELAPTLLANCALSPTLQSAVELSAALQAQVIIAPSFVGTLEIGVMNCEGELSHGELLRENSIDVRIVGLKLSGAFVNDAICTMTLRTSAGTVVTGAENLTLASETTSGQYLGRLPGNLDLELNGEYKLKARATNAAGTIIGTWNADLIATDRPASYCS